MNSAAPREKAVWLALSGLTVGSGFYTYFSWPVVAIMMVVPVAWKTFKTPSPSEKRMMLLAYFIPMFVAMAPMICAFLNRSFGTYYSFMMNVGRHEPFFDYFGRVARILAGFLWGYKISIYSYGPVWGGFFNPLTGTLMVIGFLVLPKRTASVQWAWVYAAALVFFSPDLLSAPPLSEMRVIQILPLFSFAAVQGLEWLLELLSRRSRTAFLAAILLVSTGLDTIHLQKSREVMNNYWDFLKTKENAVAFPILEKQSREQGPGLILTELNLSVFHDYSLRIACFPFNADDHPEWPSDKAHWAALVVNIHYQPFLAKAFPDGSWFWLSKDVEPAQNDYDGGLMLGILPVNGRTRRRIEDWRKANRQLDEVLKQFVRLPIDPARKNSIRMMDELEPLLSHDPLVRACYWDIQFSLHNWDNMFGHPSPENFRASFKAMRMAVQEGYPAAHFYNELAGFYILENKYNLAERAYQSALHAPLDLTPAKENLAALKRKEQSQEDRIK